MKLTVKAYCRITASMSELAACLLAGAAEVLAARAVRATAVVEKRILI